METAVINLDLEKDKEYLDMLVEFDRKMTFASKPAAEKTSHKFDTVE